ncbi:MAG TPA: DUF4190 domain-containing protein [Chthoniobacterales bacterium]|nr:DUF4190 domain-containing protein [Chthoniobacterales bacterium]
MITAHSVGSARTINAAEEELSALPIWTVTLGIFSLLTFGLTSVPSIICGHLALSRTPGVGRSFEKSVATVGLALGYIGTVVLGTWIAVLTGYLLH